MSYPATGYLHVIVLHDNAGTIEFMNENHLAWIGSAFVHEPRFDIELLIIKEVPRQLAQTGRTISVNVNGSGRDGGIVEQRAVLEVVIRMMMGDENVAQPIE